MRYRLNEAKHVEGLEQDVNAAIEDGCRPLCVGWVVNSQANTYAWWFYQAMTREEAPGRRPLDERAL